MKKLETKFGTMYYEKAHSYEPFKYVLLDSDKNWFRNIYNVKELEWIANYSDFTEFVESGYSCMCYAKGTKQDLLEVINDLFEDLNSRYPGDYEPMTLEELENNEYCNRIGEYHMFFLE